MIKVEMWLLGRRLEQRICPLFSSCGQFRQTSTTFTKSPHFFLEQREVIRWKEERFGREMVSVYDNAVRLTRWLTMPHADIASERVISVVKILRPIMIIIMAVNCQLSFWIRKAPQNERKWWRFRWNFVHLNTKRLVTMIIIWFSTNGTRYQIISKSNEKLSIIKQN